MQGGVDPAACEPVRALGSHSESSGLGSVSPPWAPMHTSLRQLQSLSASFLKIPLPW